MARSGSGKLQVARHTLPVRDTVVGFTPLPSALIARYWLAVVKITPCAYGMPALVNALRFCRDTALAFGLLPLAVMVSCLPVVAMTRRYAYGIPLPVNASRSCRGI